MFEHYGAKLLTKEAIAKDWALLKKISQAKKLAVWRIGVNIEHQSYPTQPTKHCQKKISFYLAAFLIGAQPYSYFQYGWSWDLHTGPLAGHPDLKKPLGKPLADYTRLNPNRWVFERELQDVNIWVDLNTCEWRIQ